MDNFSSNPFDTPPKATTPGRMQVVLIPEEMKVLEQCKQEAFAKRGLPSGILGGSAFYFLVKSGVIKPHLKYGPIPAVAIGFLMAAITGNATYQMGCIRKVMELPNSNLKKQVEAMLQQNKTVILGPQPYVEVEDAEVDPVRQMVTGAQMETYTTTSSFDGYHGVDIDSDQPTKLDNVALPLPKYEGPSQTYDELRRRNREDYIRSGSSRSPQQPQRQQQWTDPRLSPSQPVLPEERFDKDRVPQYQLND